MPDYSVTYRVSVRNAANRQVAERLARERVAAAVTLGGPPLAVTYVCLDAEYEVDAAPVQTGIIGGVEAVVNELSALSTGERSANEE